MDCELWRRQSGHGQNSKLKQQRRDRNMGVLHDERKKHYYYQISHLYVQLAVFSGRLSH